MKRIIMLTLLIAAGVAFAASSTPAGEVAELTTTNQPLVIYCWEGRGVSIWTRFEIYYHQSSSSLVGRMWGTWWRGEELGGWIEGRGYPDPAGTEHRIIGEGEFGGDDQGGWEGTFILNRECWGAVWTPEGIERFRGEACQ